jgi:hypothetical protein
MLFQVVSADISAHDVTSRTGYNLCMARGWESKAVEEQQAEARTKPDPNKVRLEPEQVAKQKERQGLLLSRQRVLQQLHCAEPLSSQDVGSGFGGFGGTTRTPGLGLRFN